jgi:hypothetical protein
VNLQEDNIDTIKKSTETFIDASKEVGLEINAVLSTESLHRLHKNNKQIV